MAQTGAQSAASRAAVMRWWFIVFFLPIETQPYSGDCMLVTTPLRGCPLYFASGPSRKLLNLLERKGLEAII
jgi:hypothetical protein